MTLIIINTITISSLNFVYFTYFFVDEVIIGQASNPYIKNIIDKIK